MPYYLLKYLSPLTVEQFYSSLLLTIGIIGICVIFISLLLFFLKKNKQFSGLSRTSQNFQNNNKSTSVPVGRWILWYGLASFWLVDAILQIQPPMSSSMFVDMVVAPVLQGEPTWYLRTLGQGIQLWTNHQIASAVFAAVIQLAIAVFLFLGKDRRIGKIGLWISIAWSLVVWTLGEGMGGILSGSPTFITGSPGSVILYIVAAVLLLLPISRWEDGGIHRRIGKWISLFWVMTVVWQVLPSDGFWTWQGLSSGIFENTFETPQPPFILMPIQIFSHLVEQHPILWNGFFVLMMLMLAVGYLFTTCKRCTWMLTVFWLFFTWWVGQDFGVVGGVGTDPNISPMVALVIYSAWYVERPITDYNQLHLFLRMTKRVRTYKMWIRQHPRVIYGTFTLFSVLLLFTSYTVAPAIASNGITIKSIQAYQKSRQSFSTKNLTERFMRINTKNHRVYFQLTATTTPLGDVDFDGFANGYLQVVVPVGWNVDVTFKNNQSLVINSAMIVPLHEIQGGAFTPAFKNAYTPHPTIGIGTNEVSTFQFMANRAGLYAIVSAVPDGQTDSGLWARFDVSTRTKIPYIVAK
ncbi:sulfocyanin-like copper-binding protein [Sulfoacidibacillus ferrooxidans]|uniref:Sulfocyanin-like C-terminal domain-containing protein n=1 Tax=Sulfoacidibacillus ferrooxidans TaxID=2005001 RepID=A0A9X1VBZ9_9BACL|nr:sulfocyanin-like copper-binding protein [Sulfoacidibacillus ferrooxidans]MCI0184535.1 hypothetical protein [Sulfoacidibacillus ferrooxidans]